MKKKALSIAVVSILLATVLISQVLIVPQISASGPDGTVELQAIRKDTMQLLDSDGPIEYYLDSPGGRIVHLTVSFDVAESIASPARWIAILRVTKIVAGAAALGVALMVGQTWVGGVLVFSGTLAITFKSTTDFEWVINRTGTWTFDLDGTMQRATGVGGIVVPVDKLALLAPYIGLASTILVATVTTAIYIKRVKNRKNKQ